MDTFCSVRISDEKRTFDALYSPIHPATDMAESHIRGRYLNLMTKTKTAGKNPAVVCFLRDNGPLFGRCSPLFSDNSG